MVSETTTKHTPGPWTTAEREDGHIDILHRYETPERGPGHEVAGVAVISYAMEATEANARLIAAAPLLLAAAEKAIRELDADHACLFCAANVRGVDATAFHPAHEEHAEDCPEPALRAAVAAARGEGSAQ